MESKRIIDHKPVAMTDEEWKIYQEMCASYDNPPSQNGKDLFYDLFETNGDGIIIMLKPPKRQTSFEILFFVSNLMLQQHLRLMHQKVDSICQEMVNKNSELAEQLKAVGSKKKKKSDA